MSLYFRTMERKAFMEIFPTVIRLADINHCIVLHNGIVIPVQPPRETAEYPVLRPSMDVTANPVHFVYFGSTEFVPLGSNVHARSGDKANNSNVGFFVRHADR
ncbi:hypothetical protein MN608_08494 [Microdochium nivale]|nr:hypothetical protein MN608_08494 [Microdochium nivale]